MRQAPWVARRLAEHDLDHGSRLRWDRAVALSWLNLARVACTISFAFLSDSTALHAYA